MRYFPKRIQHSYENININFTLFKCIPLFQCFGNCLARMYANTSWLVTLLQNCAETVQEVNIEKMNLPRITENLGKSENCKLSNFG